MTYEIIFHRINTLLKVKGLFLSYIFSHYDSLDLFFHKLASLGSDLIGSSLGTLCMTKFIKLHALKLLVFFEVYSPSLTSVQKVIHNDDLND